MTPPRRAALPRIDTSPGRVPGRENATPPCAHAQDLLGKCGSPWGEFGRAAGGRGTALGDRGTFSAGAG
jgi:hypothetical protein